MKLSPFLVMSRGAALAGAVLALATGDASASSALPQTPANVSAASVQALSLGVLGNAAAFTGGAAVTFGDLSSASQFLGLTSSPAFAAPTLRQMAPRPDPTAALFGLALVGFCTLARLGTRTDAGDGGKMMAGPTAR